MWTVFSGKEGIHWYFLFSSTKYVPRHICISNHAFLFVSSISAYKYHIRHIINFLLTSLLGMYQVCKEKYRTSVFLYKPRPTGSRSVCTKDLGQIFLCTVYRHRIRINQKVHSAKICPRAKQV
jgi:hypothetical protein